jgi:hypothetical protein
MKKFPSNLLLPLLLAAALPSCAQVKVTPTLVDTNPQILAAVKSMPSGGGYDATQAAVDRLAASVTLEDRSFKQDLGKAKATFCSGATYLVFLRSIEKLNLTKSLPHKTLTRYANLGVKDGEEVFGRWNANGPGTAKLFTDLACGTNFTSYAHARPGDFMKMWWTEAIGGKERGHLVVYLGATGDQVHFWSANEPGGYGRKSVAKSKIKHVLFSRLTNPSALKNAAKLSAKDQFLADMLRKDFTWPQVVKACKVKEIP